MCKCASVQVCCLSHKSPATAGVCSVGSALALLEMPPIAGLSPARKSARTVEDGETDGDISDSSLPRLPPEMATPTRGDSGGGGPPGEGALTRCDWEAHGQAACTADNFS